MSVLNASKVDPWNFRSFPDQEWFVHAREREKEGSEKLSSRSMHVPRCFVEEDRGKRKKEERSDGCCLEASPAKCPLTMAKRVLGPVKG